MFAGECKDYHGSDLNIVIVDHFKQRLERFSPQDFPEKIRKLVDYQYRWIYDFTISLMNNEQWAIDLTYYAFDSGKKKKDLNNIIEKYKSKTKEQKKIHKEALAYIKGKKFKEFERLIENG